MENKEVTAIEICNNQNQELNNDEKTDKKSVASFLHKATNTSKRLVKTAYSEAKSTIEKLKKDKLNPLFLEEYKNKNFKIPNIIKIVDDAERREIKVCDGAIGWRGKENGTEILFLYDEAINVSGIEFIPTFNCNAIYYVDSFDRNRFINVDCIFSKAQEEKLAELENIAYCLGAKQCSIDLLFSEVISNTIANNINSTISSSSKLNENIISASVNYNSGIENIFKSSGKSITDFQGHNNPIKPKLKWFRYDDTIKNLIDMRCLNPDSIKTRTLELSGASTVTMSQQTAMTIDILKSKAKSKINMKLSDLSNKEINSKMIFNIVF